MATYQERLMNEREPLSEITITPEPCHDIACDAERQKVRNLLRQNKVLRRELRKYRKLFNTRLAKEHANRVKAMNETHLQLPPGTLRSP